MFFEMLKSVTETGVRKAKVVFLRYRHEKFLSDHQTYFSKSYTYLTEIRTYP